MYSFGATPYQNMDKFEIAKKIVEGKTLEIPSLCPKEISKLIQSCWAFEPEQRPNFQYICAQLDNQIRAEKQNSTRRSKFLATTNSEMQYTTMLQIFPQLALDPKIEYENDL
jgi:hypothetical protein